MLTSAPDGFTRIAVVHRQKRTSVSIDDVLFEALARREGGDDEALRWVRAAVGEVEQLQDRCDPRVTVKKAGLSRLIQRLVIDRIAGPEPAMAQTSPRPHTPDREPAEGQ